MQPPQSSALPAPPASYAANGVPAPVPRPFLAPSSAGLNAPLMGGLPQAHFPAAGPNAVAQPEGIATSPTQGLRTEAPSAPEGVPFAAPPVSLPSQVLPALNAQPQQAPVPVGSFPVSGQPAAQLGYPQSGAIIADTHAAAAAPTALTGATATDCPSSGSVPVAPEVGSGPLPSATHSSATADTATVSTVAAGLPLNKLPSTEAPVGVFSLETGAVAMDINGGMAPTVTPSTPAAAAAPTVETTQAVPQVAEQASGADAGESAVEVINGGVNRASRMTI